MRIRLKCLWGQGFGSLEVLSFGLWRPGFGQSLFTLTVLNFMVEVYW